MPGKRKPQALAKKAKADIRPKEQAGQPEADASKQARSDLTAIIFDSDDQPLLGAGIDL